MKLASDICLSRPPKNIPKATSDILNERIISNDSAFKMNRPFKILTITVSIVPVILKTLDISGKLLISQAVSEAA